MNKFKLLKKFIKWIGQFRLIKQKMCGIGDFIQRFLSDLKFEKSDQSNPQDNSSEDKIDYLRKIYLNIERKKPKSDDFTISEYSHKVILYGYIIVCYFNVVLFFSFMFKLN